MVYNHFNVESLIEHLGYSANIKSHNEGMYDFTYNIEIEGFPRPMIGIVKRDSRDNIEIQKMHIKQWNKNDIPVCIVVFSDEIRIYNNYNYNIEQSLLYSTTDKTNNLIELEDLSNENIISGMFWEKLKNIINPKERVDRKLLRNLIDTINKISQNSNIDRVLSYSFLAKCIFIKYLEDRKMLTENTFKKYNAVSFFTLINNKDTQKIIDFLSFLKDKFNGDVFDNGKYSLNHLESSIDWICEFFEGTEIVSGQKSIFPYDFSIIPIELLSNIYERLFDETNDKSKKKKTGTFYTPYFLADFILERAIKSELTMNFSKESKVIDPACGSGVFLVGFFKKIVETYKKCETAITPDLLKSILNTQIFGVNIEENALNITAFSLYIALLEYLDPKDIEENDFKFPNLINETLFHCSVFDEKKRFNKIKADIIIGNPPWASVKGDHVEYCNNHGKEISDNQLAQAFIHRATDFVTENGIISLIVTNSIFYNTNAKNFRKQILEKYEVIEIINLNSVSSKLFANAASPCSIITFKKTSCHEKTRFFSFKPNVFSEFSNKIVFDFSQPTVLNKTKLIADDYLWCVILHGNQFDYFLIKKLLKQPMLTNLLHENDLFISRGYISGNRKYKTDDFIDLPILNGLSPYFISSKNVKNILRGTLEYERIRDKKVYINNAKLIIKRTFSRKYDVCSAALFFENLLFNCSYYGIVGNSNNTNTINVLRYLEALLNSKLYTYFQIHMSAVLKAIQPEIRMDKIKEFPAFPYNSDNSIIKKITELSKQIHNVYSTPTLTELEGENTDLITVKAYDIKKSIDNLFFDLYQLSKEERDTVLYTLDYIVPMINNKKTTAASVSDVEEYCDIVSNHFSDLINADGFKVVYEIKSSLAYYKVIFVIVESETEYNKESISNMPPVIELLALLSAEQFNSNLLINKKVKGFYNNAFYIAKTKDSHNWSRFNAIFDINEFTEDIFSEDENKEEIQE